MNHAQPILPLLPEGAADAPIAWLGDEPVSRAAFLRDIEAIARRLPAGQPVLNLCADRYLFAVASFGAMLADALCLMPNTVSPQVIAQLATAHPGLSALVDARGDARGLPAIAVARSLDGSLPQHVPGVPADRVVARLFTSGSTGQPQAHDKTWGKLVLNTQLAARAQWARCGGPCAVLATVPAQHMFGFESSVLLPVLGGGQLTAPHPLFPADVAATLAAMPEPRALVSTPFHLRALIESGLPLPRTQLVICATAPLSPELATAVEAATGGVLSEIYGSTETGQIANRRAALERDWTCFPGVSLTQPGEYTLAAGAHLEAPMPLGDLIELIDPPPLGDMPQRFRLLGRLSDLVNIAGKRTSINHLNSVLLAIPGVQDGVFHLPVEAPADGIARLAAAVVAPGLKPAEVLAALRTRIDPVFLPRPLVFVERLPRNASGKLPRAQLEALLGTPGTAS